MTRQSVQNTNWPPIGQMNINYFHNLWMSYLLAQKATMNSIECSNKTKILFGSIIDCFPWNSFQAWELKNRNKHPSTVYWCKCEWPILLSRYIAATQLEEIGGRMMFPGFDEPDFKATFNVTVVRPPFHTSLSNMPTVEVRNRFQSFYCGSIEIFSRSDIYWSLALLSIVLNRVRRATITG